MRRLVSSVLLACGLVLPGAAAASAGPAPARVQERAAPGKKVCAIKDSRLTELSGLVATEDGFIVVNDGVDTAEGRRIFFLDAKCKVVDEVAYPTRPIDTEDLALSPDGKTLWIADIGDNVTNTERRSRIALWSVPVDGSKKPVIHRVSYPDGNFNAESLLIDGDGVPIIATSEPRKSGLYVPAEPLKANNDTPVPLRRAGEVTIPPSTTSNPLLGPGRLVLTGGAVAPGGGKVALRTYADAFEWDVKGGDVIAALTTTQPRVTPLPDEPFGEAIAYSADGSTFLTVSDAGQLEDDVEINILRYTPATKVAATAAGKTAAADKSGGRSWLAGLTLQDITLLIGAVGVLGAILVGAGVFGIVRARRRPAVARTGKVAKTGKKASAPDPDDAQTASMDAVVDEPAFGDPGPGGEYRSGQPVAGRRPPAGPGQRSGAVYGAGSGSGVYGGRPAAPPPPSSGAVYGGTPGVYGGGRYRSADPPTDEPDDGYRRNGYAEHAAGVYGRSAHPGPDPRGHGRTPR